MKFNYICITLILLIICAINGYYIPWPANEGYFTQKIDHFSFSANNLTFKQRYLYENRWYKAGGPIFFYCGNEGNIEGFWNNTGFMFELAPNFGAFILFAEHRYYGVSLPFPRSFEQPYIQYLSVDQALADFAYLINGVKSKFNLTKSSVIAFGGSYGGMLAAYMRMKYPHIIRGAIASSAPVRWVAGEGRFHEFFESVTNDYRMVDVRCPQKIKEAFNLAVDLIGQNQTGFQQVTKELRLCDPIKSAHDLYWVLKWARNAFVFMTMLDYPYNADFISHLPANPVNISCKQALQETELLPLLREAIGVYYNSTKDLKCFDFKSEYIECADITGCGLGNDSLAWDFQACTEMNLFDPSESTPSDMFVSLPLTKEELIQYCQSRWGVTPSFNQLSTFYGEKIWESSSNIVFSNGDLDPWRGGGILFEPTEKTVAVTIHGGAHHLDLRFPDPADPPSARDVRQIEVQNIHLWLDSA